MRTLLSLALLAALAACGGAPDRAPEDAAAPPPAVSTTPAPVPAPVDAAAPVPSVEQTGLAGFSGYGDVKLGIAAADMEQAWGGALERLGPPQDDACYYLRPKRAARSDNDPAFMVEGGTFVRYDIAGDKEVAPGGGRIGMSKADIARLYPGRIEEQPHKYTDGQYLRIKDPAGGKGVLLFETDGKGDAAKVVRWRVGLAPQADYVEGCS
ncbi:lectin [Thermomonas brevis]|uniref:Lectin n=1 Tax=Thermomonas brevis TaxID=215691 RepID=A0A7G9QX19_9GAMM|nr:lectin [Thermomonas brevis]QNN47894.1 lectin [Thermomonas brevis]